MAALMAPLAAVAVFATTQISATHDRYVSAHQLVQVASDIGVLGDLIHALQVERGLSAGFLGSKGQRGAEPLRAARMKVDEMGAKLPEALAGVSSRGVVEQTSIAQTKDALGKITLIRADIDGLKIEGRASFSYFTGVVSGLIDVSRTHSLSSASEGDAGRLVAYNLFLNAKELAGQERGTGNGFISAGKSDPKRFLAFSGMHGAQSSLMSQALKLVREDDRILLSGILNDDDPAVIEQMRNGLISGGAGADLTSLSAPDWFAATTKRIDRLKRVEDVLLAEIVSSATEAARTQLNSLIVISSSILAGLVVVALLASSMSYTIARPLKILTDTVERLAANDMNVRLDQSGGRDEIGRMGRAIYQCIVNTQEKAEFDRQQELSKQAAAREAEIEGEREQARRAAEIAAAVQALGQGLSALAGGETTYRIEQIFAGDLDRLRSDFNDSMEKLHAAMAEISSSSEAIHSGSNELGQAADDLAQRTERQAAALEEASASLAGVSATLKDSVVRAETVGNLVDTAMSDAKRTEAVVSNAVEAITQIERSSDQVGQIIGVIDEIAFQTNLLALNAGVEAARAGEAGKGFAVVAQEVRELAQRSATAAREIKALIQRSAQEVQVGVALVGQTGQAIQSIGANVSTIKDQVSAIVSSSRDQATSITEISTAIDQMDQMTQLNAAMVEEANAATHSLGVEVNRLNQQVDMFRASPARRIRSAA
ncbi:methyl-accepting chemotaxis protein [Rhizobium sp. G187]|uniref:methyl-accepting chemotaxis protein n=1 Tax=Rhizobium sp. G187 TaxID=3451352 RepID=UPI003EE56F99